jgi:hypothetical protein
VKNEHCIGRVPLRITNRFAERGVVQPQLGQRLAGMKLKIVNDEVAFRGSGAGRLLSKARNGRQKRGQKRPTDKIPEGLEHLSPLRAKIYHESMSKASDTPAPCATCVDRGL